MLDTAGGIAKTIAPFVPLLVGLGKEGGHVKRADVVKKIMAEKGMKLIDASKYVNENNLYTPKEKGKEDQRNERRHST